MSEQTPTSHIPPINQSGSEDADLLTMVKRMQQQLVFLEKKIDTLLNQTQSRPSQEKHFSKPPQSYGRPFRSEQNYDRRENRDNFKSKNFKGGDYRDNRQQGDDRNRKFGSHPKKYNDYHDSDERSSGQDRPFKKKFGGKKEGFDPRKKMFSPKRKEY